uniref:hypothetical protein n=1 Tax=Amycolatopsis sp. CA-151526 TaxID=3239921 RepID=UPI003F4962E1
MLALMYEVDTVRDHGFADGLRRATPLLTSSYAAQVSAAPSVPPDAQWQLWTAHQAYTKVTATPAGEDRPADTDQVAYRDYQVAVNPTGRDGWTGNPLTMIALVTLEHATGGWTVAKIDFK